MDADIALSEWGSAAAAVQQRQRTTTTTATFRRPFSLLGADRMVPAGDYRVVTDEELIEGLSFPAYRRVSTVVFLPGTRPGSWEMLAIDPRDLAAAQERDREATTP
jgi:hypothetical protein